MKLINNPISFVCLLLVMMSSFCFNRKVNQLNNEEKESCLVNKEGPDFLEIFKSLKDTLSIENQDKYETITLSIVCAKENKPIQIELFDHRTELGYEVLYFYDQELKENAVKMIDSMGATSRVPARFVRIIATLKTCRRATILRTKRLSPRSGTPITQTSGYFVPRHADQQNASTTTSQHTIASTAALSP